MMRSRVSLEQVTDRIGDGLHGTPKYSETGDIPFINGNNLKSGRIAVDGKTKYVNEDEYDKHAKSLNDRTVLLSINGTIGNVALYRGEKVVLGKSACYFKCNEDIDPRFLVYLLNDRVFQGHIRQSATGTTIKNVSLALIREYEFDLPLLSDQKAIAHILGTLDCKIELNQKMNQTLEEIAMAIFKSWFVDFDPVRAKMEGKPTGLPPEIDELFPDELVDSEIGEIPKGWKLSMLSEVFDIQGGSQPPAKTFIDEEEEGYVRLLQIRDYDNSNHKTYVPAKKNLRLVDEDDVLIGRYGSGNGKFMEDSLGRPLRGLSGAINVAVVRTIPKLENSREFIATIISSGLFYKLIVGGSARAVQAGFKKDDLDYIKLPVPSPEILSVYEEFGSLIWARTKTFREENRILAELRDTLLPKLISGELRIPDAEKFLEEAGI